LLRRSYNYAETTNETMMHNGTILNVDNSSMERSSAGIEGYIETKVGQGYIVP
jgi:hypothetical protein